MEKQVALALEKHFDAFRLDPLNRYEVAKLETPNGMLHNFHQWTNQKAVIAAYQVTRIEEESYFLLLIDWHRKDNYYLVLYTHNLSTTVAELQRTAPTATGMELLWSYKPFKRDGLNQERKAHFTQLVGSTDVVIPLPQSKAEIPTFLDQLFQLAHHRQLADRLPILRKPRLDEGF